MIDAPTEQEIAELNARLKPSNIPTREEARARIWHELPDYLKHDVPACMLWPVPDEQVMTKPATDEIWLSPRLHAWQAGRCAMCDEHCPLVVDHSHVTGLVRGLLCNSCNVSEGTGDAPRFVHWRSGWNPASLLGIEVTYISPVTGQGGTP